MQAIDPTVIETREVPGSVFGSEEASVQADMVYAMTRTFYVEPTTGAPLHRIEARDQTLVYDGTEVPAFVGTVQYTDESQVDSVDEVQTRATLLALAEWVFPIGAVVLGLLCIAGGLLLRRREGEQPQDENHKHLVSAEGGSPQFGSDLAEQPRQPGSVPGPARARRVSAVDPVVRPRRGTCRCRPP